VVASLKYLSAALRAAFEDDVWDSDFQGPLLHALANAAAAFGLLKESDQL
jgi:hypothetical protein